MGYLKLIILSFNEENKSSFIYDDLIKKYMIIINILIKIVKEKLQFIYIKQILNNNNNKCTCCSIM